MKNDRFVLALNDVFEAKSKEYMKSVENISSHVFSEKFNKKMRRIIRTRTNPLRLLYIERHVLVNILSMLVIAGTVLFLGILGFQNLGKHGGTYIDIDENYSVLDSELASKLDHSSVPLNTVITDYEYDIRSEICNSPTTFDDKYMYCLVPLGFAGDGIDAQRYQLYKVDLQSGEIGSMCDTPGCTHDANTYPACINNSLGYVNGSTSVGNAIWFLDSDDGISYNKIIERRGSNKKLIFENTEFCTQFEEEFFRDTPNEKYNITDFFVRDDYIYVIGYSYVYRVNRATMKAQDLINVCDEATLDTGMLVGSKLYITNSLDELFIADFDSGEVIKIADKFSYPRIYNNTLYLYNRNEYSMYRSNLDGSNTELAVSNCTSDMLIKDGYMFYIRNSDNNALVSRDLETGEETVIYDDWSFGLWLDTAEHIDRIFAIGMDADGNSVIVSFRTDGSDLWVGTLNGFDTVI